MIDRRDAALRDHGTLARPLRRRRRRSRRPGRARGERRATRGRGLSPARGRGGRRAARQHCLSPGHGGGAGDRGRPVRRRVRPLAGLPARVSRCGRAPGRDRHRPGRAARRDGGDLGPAGGRARPSRRSRATACASPCSTPGSTPRIPTSPGASRCCARSWRARPPRTATATARTASARRWARSCPRPGPRYGIAHRGGDLRRQGAVQRRVGLRHRDPGRDRVGARAGAAPSSRCRSARPSSRARRYSQVFEQAARRAQDAGTLIVAAAGNESNRPVSIQPGRAPGELPLDPRRRGTRPQPGVASFSNRGLNPDGGQIDIAGPGVDVYSSWPLPRPLPHAERHQHGHAARRRAWPRCSPRPTPAIAAPRWRGCSSRPRGAWTRPPATSGRVSSRLRDRCHSARRR